MSFVTVAKRSISTSRACHYKVAVVGAYGGIGQPLSLLMKLDPRVTHLSLYDLNPATPGMAVDLSHIPGKCKVTSHSGAELNKALEGCDVIVIPAGVPRKPGMTRDDLFNTNAGIVANIAKVAAESAPNASHLIISNPVNSTVPIYAEVMKKYGKYNKNKVYGVTTLDVIRAETFLSEVAGKQVGTVPVIGGHAGITILPILSGMGVQLTEEQVAKLTHRTMFGGDEVVQAKGGAGSATLSMAVAAHKFAQSVFSGLDGAKNVIDYTYCENSTIPELTHLAVPVVIGKEGIEKVLPLPSMNAFESQKLKEAVPELKGAINKGIEFAKAWVPK